NKKIREVIAENGSVFVSNGYWVLLHDRDALLAQTVGKAILVHFLQQAIPKIFVERKCCFSNGVRQILDSVCHEAASVWFPFVNSVPFVVRTTLDHRPA